MFGNHRYVPELSGPDIPPHIVELLRRMLAVKPEDRPRAADAHALILEKTPYYQLGAKRLEELYAQCIGPKRSGATDMLNLDLQEFGAEQRILAAARQTPLPPLSNDFGPEPNATPHEPTTAEPRDARGDEDSPIVLRRDRNRVTPADRPIVDQAMDRTSTKGPPMLDAILQPAAVKPLAVIAEPPSPATAEEYPAPPVEPTEVLPPFFADGPPRPLSMLRSEPEVDAPAQQTLQVPGGPPLPIADAPSQPLVAAPVSRPAQRSASLWILLGFVSAAAVVVGVLLGMVTTRQPAEADQQTAVGPVEVDDFGPDDDKQPSAPTSEPQPDTTPPEPVREQGVTAPVDDAADNMESSTGSIEEHPTIEPDPEPEPKPKPKSAAAPSATTASRGRTCDPARPIRFDGAAAINPTGTHRVR